VIDELTRQARTMLDLYATRAAALAGAAASSGA
jgi:hypothetical protein